MAFPDKVINACFTYLSFERVENFPLGGDR